MNRHAYPTDIQMLESISKRIHEDVESSILSQLNDFISRNLIVIEKGPLLTTMDPMTQKLEIKQSVKLILKDKEYIERLEKENKELKDLLKRIREVK